MKHDLASRLGATRLERSDEHAALLHVLHRHDIGKDDAAQTRDTLEMLGLVDTGPGVYQTPWGRVMRPRSERTNQ